ncbi:MAG: TIGR00730 family Rossman fold protein [Phycisphaerales bacterium]|nr:TIGR00730 family Rossman fold protein [Phycisphaerales bacterium]MCB9856931.1 TIGR00730 family Rossman fold protein [Phycisphaerales bacterium]MCB9861942.1 TIGR00730 family Rossman fold protein [Phycisphaerales bacterium]
MTASRKNMCVFCGSSSGRNPAFAETARRLGHAIADRGMSLVYGGGNVGLMGTVADAALEKGAKVIGVIPHSLERKEVAHRGLSELHICRTMHDRKRMMAERSDAFIALPGGYGTLEEIFEVITWAQLGIHHNPCALLNVDGFFDGLVQYLDHAVEMELLKPEFRNLLMVETDIDRLLDAVQAYKAPPVMQWIEPDET